MLSLISFLIPKYTKQKGHANDTFEKMNILLFLHPQYLKHPTGPVNSAGLTPVASHNQRIHSSKPIAGTTSKTFCNSLGFFYEQPARP